MDELETLEQEQSVTDDGSVAVDEAFLQEVDAVSNDTLLQEAVGALEEDVPVAESATAEQSDTSATSLLENAKDAVEEKAQLFMSYDGEYTSTIAKLLDTLSGLFGDNSKIGNALKSLAAKAESDFGTGQIRDAETAEIMARSGLQSEYDADEYISVDEPPVVPETISVAEAPQTLERYPTSEELAQMKLVDCSPEESKAFMESLRDRAGELVTEGEEPSEMCLNMAATVMGSATTDPVGTGYSLAYTSELVRQHAANAYGVGTEDYNVAMGYADALMSPSIETYYDTVYSMELNGNRLSVDDKAYVASLDMVGANYGYDAYVPGVSLNKTFSEDDLSSMRQVHEEMLDNGIAYADRLQRSAGVQMDGIPVEEMQSHAAMAAQGNSAVASNSMYVSGLADEDSGQFRNMHLLFSRKADAIRQEYLQNSLSISDRELLMSATANSYMTMMRGIQAYNDAAVDAINEKYVDGSVDKEVATRGLAKTMRALVGDAFSLTKEDNDALNFLSEQDLLELETMQFTGVNVRFSEYESGMDLRTGLVPDVEKSPENLMDIVSAGFGADFGQYGTSADAQREVIPEDLVVEPQAAEPVAETETVAERSARRLAELSKNPVFREAWKASRVAARERDTNVLSIE